MKINKGEFKKIKEKAEIFLDDHTFLEKGQK